MPRDKPATVASKPKPKNAEDIPGVPTAAWARVKRGVPASDPFKPGEGFMLMVDGARFLPGNCTVIQISESMVISKRIFLHLVAPT